MKSLIIFVLLCVTTECFSQTLSVTPPVFNQSATIKFTAALTDTATLTVYNRWGDLVETIFADILLSAANYSFTLHGDSLENGVYVVHLLLGNRSFNTNAVKQTVSGISNISISGSLRCYPSPSSGNFTIDMTGCNAGEKQISIYNQLGQIVYQTLSTQDKLQVNENLSSGVYTVAVSQSTKQYARVVIE